MAGKARVRQASSRRAPWALAVASLAALSACADGGDAAPTIQQVGVTSSTTSLRAGTPPSTGTGEATSEDDGQTVIDAPNSYLMFVLLDGNSFEELHDRAEGLVAECMTKAGWTYVPVPYQTIEAGVDAGATWAEVRNYMLRYGYGATANPTQVSVDPNAALIEGMTDGQRASYYSALYGDTTEADAVADPTSCRGSADSVAHEGIPMFDPAYSELPVEFLSELLADRTVQDAFSRWSACMAEAGIDVAEPDNMPSYVHSLRLGRTPDGVAEELRLAQLDADCYEDFVLQPRLTAEQRILTSWVESGKLPSALWEG